VWHSLPQILYSKPVFMICLFQIMEQIRGSGIIIYDIPCESSDLDEKDKMDTKSFKSRVPFAIVGSNTLIEPQNGDGKRVLGRKYPWGVVNVSFSFGHVTAYIPHELKLFQIENPEHCDFIPLRNMLIRTNFQHLKEVTNNVLYENFRCRKLQGVYGASIDKIQNRVRYLFFFEFKEF